MVNKLWSYLIIIGVIFSIINGKIDVLNKEIILSAKTSLDIIINLFPVLSLWLGLVNIANKSGLLEKISNLFKPLLKKIFYEIPNNHESLTYISSSFVSNLFGLSSASTPLGLKAMESLKELNNNKNEASKSMITFMVLNTTGLTLIPTTLISLRILYKSITPTKVILPCFFATLIATTFGLLLNYIVGKKYE